MDVTVAKILRKGRKSVRVLLSTGETVVFPSDKVPEVGSLYATMTSNDIEAIRPLLPTDQYPSQLRF